MVGERREPSPDSQQDQENIPLRQEGQVISRNHNIDRRRIIRIIQGSLDPIEVDPVPQRIEIDNIVIRRIAGVVAISCRVRTW
jgi:hypothetical protein